MCRKVPITIEQCCNEKIGFSELSGASEAPMGDSVGDSMGDSIPIRPFLNRPLAVIRPSSTTAQSPKNLGVSGSLVRSDTSAFHNLYSIGRATFSAVLVKTVGVLS